MAFASFLFAVPIFQVVRFPNDPCPGNAGKNGTCYTNDECESRGGLNGGVCASGFGICCIINVGCGQRSSENCTYVEASGASAGECISEVCKCHENVCQLRLDFDSFVLTGPSTSSTTTVGTLQGNVVQPVTLGLIQATTATQCLTDSFTVLNGGEIAPPTICGINNGQHSKTQIYTLTNQYHKFSLFIFSVCGCSR